MGGLILPAEGTVYLDTNSFIYSVERIDPYRAILDTLWQTVSTGQFTVITSELTLLEVLVKPLKVGDATTAATFRAVLRNTPDVQMLPITQVVLEKAANLRATLNLKTPDAIHAATAVLQSCKLFVSNDAAFRRVPSLNVAVLNEIISPPLNISTSTENDELNEDLPTAGDSAEQQV
ncbi:MAG TPA: PIN domain-containing protein [Ktedonobacteraceae bacterium]|nr:PIN domain-containing protein [Ktedonobacteraceae bacterium]